MHLNLSNEYPYVQIVTDKLEEIKPKLEKEVLDLSKI
jgi:hypothetical protein